MNDNYAYLLEGSLYINLTNACTNNCVFCIRDLNSSVKDKNLWLSKEKIDAQEVIEQIKKLNPQNQREFVFCGYGEPVIKLDLIKEISKFLKENYPQIKTRINTNGHGNLIHKRDIVPELTGLIDKVSISLNAENAELYAAISQPTYDKETAYNAVLDFIEKCVQNNIETTATIVSGYKDFKPDVEKCRQITQNLGAKFRIREWLDEGYN